MAAKSPPKATDLPRKTYITASYSQSNTQGMRPISEVTELVETEFEDDESDFEDHSRRSFDSAESRRRSQTTVSSYDEVQTPSSERCRQFDLILKPVEGPTGPHLFRASQTSADFMLDDVLQLSPIELEQINSPPRPKTAASHRTLAGTELTRSPPPLQLSVATRFDNYESVDVQFWTTSQVVSAMDRTQVLPEIIEKLWKHDISGDVVLKMKFEDLKELEIESFGKRHHLWNAFLTLRGEQSTTSCAPAPFQNISRPCTAVRSKSNGDVPLSACSASPCCEDMTPTSPLDYKQRRGRTHRSAHDPITPGESVSIVAIEQVIPKEHWCKKQEACPTFRKRERLLKLLENDHAFGDQGWPVSPTKGGKIVVYGDPGNAASAANILPGVRLAYKSPADEDFYRPHSETEPSVVASSDVLGPGQLPEFALHEDVLQKVGRRDARETVKQFLHFQHVPTSHVEEPQTPPLDLFPDQYHQQSYSSMQSPRTPSTPNHNLRSLPKLSIPPRSASANSYMPAQHQSSTPAETHLAFSRSATASPGNKRWPTRPSLGPRHGTPASEMDIPVTALPINPITRDNSQSVPPSMHYRDPVPLSRSHSRRKDDWRRPSFGLPSLSEDQVFSPITVNADDPFVTVTTAIPDVNTIVDKKKQKEMRIAKMHADFGEDVTHAGWMKKRRAKLLRYDWQDAHFRLKGTQLDMHLDNRRSASMLESLDIDDYAIACSSGPSNNKISAALKSLKIMKDEKSSNKDAAAFCFQLVPGEKDRREAVKGKTHHFTVKTADERIEWMRDLMLAKAKGQKQNGFTVEVNGQKA